MFIIYTLIIFWAKVFGYDFLNEDLFIALMATDIFIFFIFALKRTILDE